MTLKSVYEHEQLALERSHNSKLHELVIEYVGDAAAFDLAGASGSEPVADVVGCWDVVFGSADDGPEDEIHLYPEDAVELVRLEVWDQQYSAEDALGPDERVRNVQDQDVD